MGRKKLKRYILFNVIEFWYYVNSFHTKLDKDIRIIDCGPVSKIDGPYEPPGNLLRRKQGHKITRSSTGS